MKNEIFPEDPRTYIRNEYEQRHKRNPSYSWRSFARDLKLSPSMLSEFLKGRYGLSRGKANSIAQSIKLDSQHTEHFIDLLEANFHRLPVQRNLAQMRATERLQNSSSSISAESLGHIMDWISFAVMEIIGIEPKGAISKASWLKPFHHLVGEADDILKKLKDLCLVKESQGHLEASEEVTIASDQISDESSRAIHQQVLDLSSAAIREMDSTDRESISVFGSVDSNDFPEMRKEINDSILQILNKYASKKSANTVFCLGLNAFPIYKRR